jgi:predicted RNase H-like nuclease
VAVVLGIDAAWTAGQPSGVALVRDTGEVLRLSPSYAGFVNNAWMPRESGEGNVIQLLKVAAELAGEPVAVVSVDMPLSKQPITARRPADTAVSRTFGARGCATHSPSTQRPGPLGQRLTDAYVTAGYRIATQQDELGSAGCLIEAYPHPALLALTGAEQRLPYKAGKTGSYWKHEQKSERLSRLGEQWRGIRKALEGEFPDLDLPWPDFSPSGSFAAIKPYEDTLDALITAWVGLKFLRGEAVPYGDDSAAIWVPEEVIDE